MTSTTSIDRERQAAGRHRPFDQRCWHSMPAKAALAAEISHAPPPAPRLHPKLADLYRRKVERLYEELNRPELRHEAAAALRALITRSASFPMGGSRSSSAALWPGYLALASGDRMPAVANRDGLQVTLVAGAGNCLDLLLSASIYSAVS
jgi:hypothetical protein